MELLGEQPSGGPSAMAKSVGLTCGVATQLLLDGNEAIKKVGIVVPYSREVCDPIREAVEKENIMLVENKIDN
jgi:saccharopine dehydrogenase (NADP+, L-glutamate forming)